MVFFSLYLQDKNKSCKVLREDNIIGIFPEGTRSSDGNILKGNEGFVHIWNMTKLPIVPVGITGLNKVLPKGAIIPRLSSCSIEFGEPIYLQDIMEDGTIESSHQK